MRTRTVSILCLAVATVTVALGYGHKNRSLGIHDFSENPRIVSVRIAETEPPMPVVVNIVYPVETPLMTPPVTSETGSAKESADLEHESNTAVSVRSIDTGVSTQVQKETPLPKKTTVQKEEVTPKPKNTPVPTPKAKRTPAVKDTAKPKATSTPDNTPNPADMVIMQGTAAPKLTPMQSAQKTPNPVETPTPTVTVEPDAARTPAADGSETPGTSVNGMIIQDGTGPKSENESFDSEPTSSGVEVAHTSRPEDQLTEENEPALTAEPTPERVPSFSVSGSYDWYDLELAARVAYFEAGSSEGRRAVLNVIYNRCRNKEFGGKVTSLKTEVYRKSQFSVVRKEKFEQMTASDALIRMADEIFNGGKTILPDDIIFFHAESSGKEWEGKEYYKTIGGNAFFRKAS